MRLLSAGMVHGFSDHEWQWCSYTQAYPGLCPRKIHWCLGKNNVENYCQFLASAIAFMWT